MPPPAAPGTISEAKLVDKAKKWQQLQTKRYSIHVQYIEKSNT